MADEELIEYIDIGKYEIPGKILMLFKDTLLSVEVKYNDYGDFFTLTLYDQNDNLILSEHKLAYGENVLRNIYNDAIPEGLKIIPKDLGRNFNILNWKSFGEVKLYIEWG